MNNEIIGLLRQSRYFSDIEDQPLNIFAELLNPLMYHKGDIILQQGSFNDRIFFLFSGKLSVHVDNEQIMILRRVGDVFGEMSVISNKPVSADVIALNNVKTFFVQTKQLKKNTLHSAEIDALLHRVITRILSDKLWLSSQKAKQFEESTRLLSQERGKTQALVKNREKEYAQLHAVAESLAQANDRSNTMMNELENKKQELEKEVSERETTETELHM